MVNNVMTTGAGGGVGGTPTTPAPAYRTPSPMSQSGPVTATPSQPNMDAFLLGAQLFGTVMQSYGAYQEGQATAAALEHNAMMAMKDAEQVAKSEKHELHKAKTEHRRLLAKQIAATAASGRQMSGSPLSIMARSESEAQRDQEIIRSNSANAQGRLYGEASFGKGRAAGVKASARTKSLTNLLIGGSSAYAKSNYFKKSGGR